MKKTYLILATAIVAFASCSDNTYMGDPDFGGNTGNGGAISFGSSTPSLTRATGATAAEELGYSFAVYATKTVSSTTSNVFAQNSYSASSYIPYWVWYNTSTANTTTSNTANWEYVGAAGNKTIPNSGTFTLSDAQDIKYWDYSATQYDFVAYKAKPVNSTSATVTNLTTTGFTVSGTAAQLGNLYIADKKTVTLASGNYGKEVEFTFRNAAAKVRLGIYETISGYEVRNVKFYYTNSSETSSTTNAILTGSFNGTSSSATDTYTVSYDASGIATLTTATSASTYFDFGTFDTDANPAAAILGTSSTSPTWATGSNAYSVVLPNTNHVGNMTLKVDYDLYNTSSGETIHVYGAKAVVPSMYMTWNPNYAYTYLFKISDNTNGATSETGGTPAGLYPITFDAVTIAATDGQNVGTITTVSTPAITTYQNGSVSNTGITYANANGAIYITVNTDGTVKDLSVDNTKLYTVDAGTTEADLILGVKTKTAADGLSILSANATSQGITFASGKAATFTPTASTTYALEYLQIDEVTGLTEGTSPVTGYYTRTGESAPYTYTKVTDPSAKAASATKYYTVVPQYKIIVVGANPTPAP
jgi:hypothetical protein